ncbi:DNA-binding domain-containing protein [Bdellovibrio sp. NC01]|uniref:HvfC/BufC N-terminal domain-containing protein n=1 Tax=Bdellovibrio sp. NC01 TaxID=2220073 RepID=UPI001159A7B0|nr:DNA-binding domain-containing protein [Bdellovibrio sp. NC01]QDK38884.1 DUF2063 domain-containing protein [Bdellovibrio sp. NC01]
MTLNELQSLFKRQIIEGEADSAVLKIFKPGGQLSLSQAFGVYHDSYLARLTEALRETFEGVHWVLGDKLFDEVAHTYIATEPSVSYNLSDYGSNFPDFLQLQHAMMGIPFIGDLARFEWKFKNIFHAQTPNPLPVERVQELISAEDFKVNFIDAMTLFKSPYAIYELWSHRKEPQYEFEDINWNQPENLLVYKKDKKIYVRRIDATEFKVLESLQDGHSVTEALADSANTLTPDKISLLFQMMMQAGIIDDISEL